MTDLNTTLVRENFPFLLEADPVKEKNLNENHESLKSNWANKIDVLKENIRKMVLEHHKKKSNKPKRTSMTTRKMAVEHVKIKLPDKNELCDEIETCFLTSIMGLPRADACFLYHRDNKIRKISKNKRKFDEAFQNQVKNEQYGAFRHAKWENVKERYNNFVRPTFETYLKHQDEYKKRLVREYYRATIQAPGGKTFKNRNGMKVPEPDWE